MFDYDKWQEIYASVKNNKLRAILTMLGVFWGMFMLVLIIGSGNGLKNGTTSQFEGWASNTGFIWGSAATMSYKGLKPGRRIQFNNDDMAAVKDRVAGLDYFTPRDSIKNSEIRYQSKSGSFETYGVYPEYQKMQKVDLVEGRYLNALDLLEKRKVALVGKGAADVLFAPGSMPVGQHINVGGIYFKVIGVFIPRNKGRRSQDVLQSIYLPFSTYQTLFSDDRSVNVFTFLVSEGYDAIEVEGNIKQVLSERHQIHPEDKGINTFNLQKEFNKIQGIFVAINFLVWFAGLGTLLAGVVGISNIMLIIVKERSREIGIRKALGATPFSILSLIMQESVVITAIPGFLGLLIGVVLLKIVSITFEQLNVDTSMFINPEISFASALILLLILMLSGCLAGLIPANKAAAVNPIETIH